ncbi:hypothetical protein TSAR_011116 [Trichomalopsis sarcophagae]|uniref:Uncharacterized protein n=1 Tax=Trichomalopsis sarcophagae TaxID=543379 RepID=A0A232F2V4_9HYME|nr:hypothetical protein TSAR_011116 [Trichomalopsis sarcophagae]
MANCNLIKKCFRQKLLGIEGLTLLFASVYLRACVSVSHPLLPSCQASGSPRRRGALGARLRTTFSLPRPGFQTSRTRTEAGADFDEASLTPSSAAVLLSYFCGKRALFACG